MNCTRWKWLLALSLSLNLGIAAVVLVQHMRAPANQMQAPRNLPDYLQLNEAQRQHWQQLEPDFQRDIAANWSEIGQYREALVREIFSTAPQRAAIDASQARIAALQNAQQQRVIRQLLSERELLDKKQQVKLRDLLLSRYARQATEEELLHRE